MKNSKQQITIAHVTTTDISLRLLLLNQMHYLFDNGYKVVGVSGVSKGTLYLEEMNAAGIPHVAVRSLSRSFKPFDDLLAFWQLFRIFRQHRFTIVHTHNPKPGLLAQIAARLAGVPIVVNTLHGFYFHDHMKPATRKFCIIMEKIAALFSSTILSQNSEDMKTAVDEGICSPSKIKLLGNGIDLSVFNPTNYSNQSRVQRRQELNLTKQAKIIGFVGRLVREKGILELLCAVQLIRREICDVQLLIIGPLDTEKDDALTPDIAKDYGIEDRCHFLGIRNDMPDLYSIMDVFVLPSHREGYPRSAMEASAMGIPVVATDIRGCREAIRHKQNGVLVPLNNAEKLAKEILEILTVPKLALDMGQKGISISHQSFDERNVFKIVESVYDDLLKEKNIVV